MAVFLVYFCYLLYINLIIYVHISLYNKKCHKIYIGLFSMLLCFLYVRCVRLYMLFFESRYVKVVCSRVKLQERSIVKA